MKKERYYVSLMAPERLTSPPEPRWIRPGAERYAAWVDAGDDPYSYLAIHRTEGLLYHNSLKDELYTAEYR